MKKPLKITLITLSIIIGLFIIATFTLTPIVTSYINKNGEDLLGRKVTVDKIKVNIYNGHVAIYNLKLYEEDRQQEWVTFDTIKVNTSIFRLLTHQLYLNDIYLTGFDLKILQNGTTFNFSSFFQHFAKSNDKKEKSSNKWSLAFYNIHLNNGQIYYSDLQRNCDWNIHNINLQAPGFAIDDRKATEAGLSIELADGGTLQTKANYDAATNDFSIDIQLKQIDLNNAQAYLSEFSKIGKTKGTLNANITANGNISHLLDMNFSGDLHLNNVNIKSKNKEQIGSFAQLDANINKINIEQKYYDLNSLSIQGLTSRFDIYENNNNFKLIFPKDSTRAHHKSHEEKIEIFHKLQLKITDLKIANGQFVYADHTLCDPYEIPINNICITSHNFSLQRNNTAKITATMPDNGSIDIIWTGSITNWKSYQECIFDLKNIQLKTLSPYSITYLGYPFTKGTLTLHSINSIKNSEINAKHQVHIAHAEIGKKRDDITPQFKIALKPALYILTDKNDNINFELPITGDLNNPEFRYQKAIWNAIGNFLLKVISEPFRFASNAFNITNTDRFINIYPTDTNFSAAQLRSIKKYADATRKEPSLILHFEQQVDPTSEDFILELAEQRNLKLHNYLTQTLNLDPKRFTITSVDCDDLHHHGYQVSGELINATTD